MPKTDKKFEQRTIKMTQKMKQFVREQALELDLNDSEYIRELIQREMDKPKAEQEYDKFCETLELI